MPTRSSPLLQSYSEFSPAALATSHRPTLPITLSFGAMIRSIASYAARSGHPGRCGSTCAIRFNSATRAIYCLTTFDKRHSYFIGNGSTTVERQRPRSDSRHRVVTCVYVNPELQRFWVLDFRLFDPDDSSKIDHLLEMFERVLKKLC